MKKTFLKIIIILLLLIPAKATEHDKEELYKICDDGLEHMNILGFTVGEEYKSNNKDLSNLERRGPVWMNHGQNSLDCGITTADFTINIKYDGIKPRYFIYKMYAFGGKGAERGYCIQMDGSYVEDVDTFDC